MPRDSAGTYSSPSGPFVAGTPIASSPMNAKLADLGSEVGESLSRSGKGGMTAPLAFTGIAATIRSGIANSVSAVAHILDSVASLTTAGAKLLSLRNAGVEKFSVDKDGAITAAAALTGTLGLTAGGFTTTFASGAGANYTLTTPSALPGSTLPVMLSAAGALATGPITNAQQNFGTPSAATDAAIKSYVDGLTSNDAGIIIGTGASSVASKRLRKAPNGLVFFSFAATCNGSADEVAVLPAGYRPGVGVAAAAYLNGASAVKAALVNTTGSIVAETAPTNGQVVWVSGVFLAE